MSFAWCSLFLNLSYFHFFILLLHFLGGFFTFIFQLFYWICASWMMLVFVFFLESPILVSWMWYLLYYLRMIFFFSVLHFVSSKDWFVSVCFRFYLTGSRHPLDAVTHWMIGDFEYVGRWGLLTLCFTTGWSGWSQGNLQWCSLWRHQIEGGSNAALTYLPVHEPWSEAMRLPERRDALFLPQNCDRSQPVEMC